MQRPHRRCPPGAQCKQSFRQQSIKKRLGLLFGLICANLGNFMSQRNHRLDVQASPSQRPLSAAHSLWGIPKLG